MSTLFDPLESAAPPAALPRCRACARHVPDAEGLADQPLFNAA